MFSDFPLFPEVASSVASSVDNLYFFLIAVCGVMALIVFVAVIYFMIRYRRKPGNEIPEEYETPEWLEIGLISVWFVMFMAMFFWGAKVYFESQRPPDDSIDIYATGRQWMWKFQHLGGQREINELHVPVGQAVRLIMSSEDVIHSFFVPDFRVKKDVIPHRYTIAWFRATKVGRYHLFCTEYCGTEHSGMVGWVTVMEPDDYQVWAAGGAAEQSPAAQGKKLFQDYACNTCHTEAPGGRGPVLTNIFGSTRPLRDGRSVIADENYIRQSITDPQSQIVSGFEPIMPTFKGQLNEAQLMQLVAYMKSLSSRPAEATGAATSGTQPGTGVAAEPPLKGPSRTGTNAQQNPTDSQTTTGGTN